MSFEEWLEMKRREHETLAHLVWLQELYKKWVAAQEAEDDDE